MQDFAASSNETKQVDASKGCHNCVHRFGLLREFWKCSRTGYFTEVEMKSGGRCAEGLVGSELRLWSPRPTLLASVIGIFRGTSAVTSSTEEQKP